MHTYLYVSIYFSSRKQEERRDFLFTILHVKVKKDHNESISRASYEVSSPSEYQMHGAKLVSKRNSLLRPWHGRDLFTCAPAEVA